VRIVVFGAGGFVGGWICEELSQRHDIEQVACVRKWASAVRLARRGVDIRRADLEDADAVASVLTGADVIVNAAMPVPAHEADLVTRLYAAGRRAGVRRFVQFSSAAIYGDRAGEVDESMAPSPVDAYSRGKTEMERRLGEVAAGQGVHLFILRPSIIYGPFSDAWTVRYVERIIRGRWRGLGRFGDGSCNLVHAHDVAKAAITAATGNIPQGIHVLNINGPDVVSWNDYIERLGDALGTHDRVVPSAVLFRGMAIVAEVMRMGAQVPFARSLYRWSAGATRAVMTNAQAATKLYPSLDELSLLKRKVHYSARLAHRVLHFRPSVSLDDGLRQSVAWCRLHGIV
jgi:nucleoside-diphosphate-sugar epimerase